MHYHIWKSIQHCDVPFPILGIKHTNRWILMYRIFSDLLMYKDCLSWNNLCLLKFTYKRKTSIQLHSTCWSQSSIFLKLHSYFTVTRLHYRYVSIIFYCKMNAVPQCSRWHRDGNLTATHNTDAVECEWRFIFSNKLHAHICVHIAHYRCAKAVIT